MEDQVSVERVLYSDAREDGGRGSERVERRRGSAARVVEMSGRSARRESRSEGGVDMRGSWLGGGRRQS